MAEAAGVGPDRLPFVLLGFGLDGAVGTFAGGGLTDRFPGTSLVLSCLLGGRRPTASPGSRCRSQPPPA